MNRREWTTVDKTAWGPGPWQEEPDKVQWIDEATELDCLIVRGPSGALCGYVGVPEGHPYHGVDYSGCPLGEECSTRTEERPWCDHEPESAMEVHGGLTFSSFCHEPKDGDHSHGICHVPEPGRPAKVWWLGFDCAHSGDLAPKFDSHYRGGGFGGDYREIAYVERQVGSLARQLAEVTR